VLNADHSDFSSLREALLLPTIMKVSNGSSARTLGANTYMSCAVTLQSLKDSTRLDKYEPFRTERLLARQASPEAVTGIIREPDRL
jgi:septin family protein